MLLGLLGPLVACCAWQSLACRRRCVARASTQLQLFDAVQLPEIADDSMMLLPLMLLLVSRSHGSTTWHSKCWAPAAAAARVQRALRPAAPST
jgi:hypothetical protein